TILESIKSSSLWNSFKVFNLQTPVRDSYNLEYSKFMNDVGDAILCPLNIEVNIINNTILQQLKGDTVNLYSTDDLADDKTQENNINQRNMPTTELMNSFNAPRIPQHCLTLKQGCVATIMRNLSLQDGLCKNSRVIITNIGHRLITVKNPITNCIAHLPRITFLFRSSHFPFKIRRHQFPLRLAYSSTFNSSQGLTLDRVVLDLHTLVFSHGQLYTALTRVRQRNHILLLIEKDQTSNFFTTKNI
ncbi:3928_t:CDS:2, partial [Cetraspora pellucida]